jgi:hypothetical protein
MFRENLCPSSGETTVSHTRPKHVVKRNKHTKKNCASNWLYLFENRVLRRVFGPKREEVTGELGKLHNEELSDLYSLPNIVRVVKSRRMRWAGHVARMGQGRGVHRFLVGKSEGKRPLGRPRRKWEDNKMDLQEVGCGGYGLDRAGSG